MFCFKLSIYFSEANHGLILVCTTDSQSNVVQIARVDMNIAPNMCEYPALDTAVCIINDIMNS